MSKHTPFDRRIVLDWLQWGKFPEGNNAPQIALDYIGELERKLAEKDAELLLITNRISSKDAIIEKLKEQRNHAVYGQYCSEFTKKAWIERQDAELAELEEKGDKV